MSNSFVSVSKKKISPGESSVDGVPLHFQSRQFTYSNVTAPSAAVADLRIPTINPLSWAGASNALPFERSMGSSRPTGRFDAGTNTNVGSGYWTSVVASGQTIYLNSSKATALSAFEMYEFHGTQEGTMVHPGQTLDLDYSLTHSLNLQPNLRLQLGLAGYGQWQTSDKHGPSITLEQATARYKVNALGFAANAILPEQKVSVGVKYFHEFECRSTYQGYTLQISGTITF